jgi:hypothetical protein
MTEKIGVVDQKQELVDRLHYFRDSFKDNIPRKIIHSIDKKKNYKVRTGWFVGLAADLENAIREKTIDKPEIRIEVNEFLDWYKNDFGLRPGNPKNTKEDIERGNKVINAVLESLGETAK